MDQFTAMRVFARVAERGSFSAAADELELSRPAASAHVAALEKHLGVRLLNRTTRKVSLTPEGSEFLASCRRIFDELKEAGEPTARLERKRFETSVNIRALQSISEDHKLTKSEEDALKRQRDESRSRLKEVERAIEGKIRKIAEEAKRKGRAERQP